MSEFFIAFFITIGIVTLARLLAFYLLSVGRDCVHDLKLYQAHRRRKRAFRPLVTVIIQDRPFGDLQACLESVAESTYKDTHVVILTSAPARTAKTVRKMRSAYPRLSTQILTARTKRSKAALPKRALKAVRGGFCLWLSSDQYLDEVALQRAVAEFTVKPVSAVVLQRRNKRYTTVTEALQNIGQSATIWQQTLGSYDFFTAPVLVRKRLLNEQSEFTQEDVIQADAVVYASASEMISSASLWTRLSPILLAAMAVALALADMTFYAYILSVSLTLLAGVVVAEMPRLRHIDRVNFLLLAPLLWPYLSVRSVFIAALSQHHD